jgi:integrase
MGEAVDLGYTNNLSFRHSKFTYSEGETYAIYLTQEEIVTLYDFDFSNNKRLERVRDLFVFGCLTGSRFSDITTIQPENFQRHGKELYIHKITQKTKELVVIPCDEIVTNILGKYEGSMPKAPSNQKFNEYIKEVCKITGLKEKGRLPSKPEKEVWQCVSSHTARRSFATNRFVEGFEPIELMRITGHKSEKAFLKYIKVSKQDSARRLSELARLKR